MCDTIDDILSALRDLVGALRPEELNGPAAVSFLEAFSETERLAAAARTLAARRVADTRAHFGTRFRTATQLVASTTGSTLGAAAAALETARRLEDLPATRERFVSGLLSEVQAIEIAATAALDPSAEPSLLDLASVESVATLKDRCRQLTAAATSDEESVERIRMGRYVRNSIDRDGALRIEARLAPDDGAGLVATLRARATDLQNEARRSGRRERFEAHLADALIGLAAGESGPRGVVTVVVDAAAFERGHTEAGEFCRIEGIGPVPVASARRLAMNASVRLIGTDGADVTRVAHLGRAIPARVRTALEARDPTCVVPGCDIRTGLEIDHIMPLSEGGTTSLANLARLCRAHHAEKTHHGWALGGSAGAWTWTRAARPWTKGRRRPRAP